MKWVIWTVGGVLGALWAASGVGSLLGAMALVWWPTQHRTLRIRVAAVMGPVGLTVMALTRDPAVAILASGITSAAFSSQLNMFQAMLQESTPRAFRGRVMSLSGISFNGTIPFAGIASSAAAVWLGLPAVMLIAAACYLVTVLYVMRFGAGGIECARDHARARNRPMFDAPRPNFDAPFAFELARGVQQEQRLIEQVMFGLEARREAIGKLVQSTHGQARGPMSAMQTGERG